MNTRTEQSEIERLREENRHLRDLLSGRPGGQTGNDDNSDANSKAKELSGAREDLKQRARLTDTILSSITDFAYVFDREGRFTFINQALLDLWHLPLEAARGKTFFELPYPPDLAARLQRQIQSVYETGQKLRDETSYTSPTGQTGYFEYIFVPVFDKDGNVDSVVGSTRDITLRQQAIAEKEALLKALELERARLSNFFLQAPAFIAVVRGPQHVFEMANPLYYQLIGRRDIIGRSVRDAFPDVEGQGFFEILDEVYRTGLPYIGKDMRIVFQGDEESKPREHSIDFIYQPLVESDGTVSGIFVHGVDLTERRLAHEALRESEERVRLATEAAGLGIWVWEPATDRVTWENDRMYEIYGLSPTDEPWTSAQFMKEIVHPDDAGAFARAIAVPAETGDPLHFVGRFRRADGALRWIEFWGRRQRPAAGEPLRVVGTAADITDRKRAEEWERQAIEDAATAAETNAKFRTFFEQGSYFAGVMSTDGTLIEANRLCLDFCGFAKEAVIGKKFWDCGWWNRSSELMEMVREGTREAAAGRLFRRESAYFVADGSQRFVDLILAPVKDEEGRVLFIAPTGTDITEQKRAEAELKAANDRLTSSMTETHHRVKNNLQLITAMIDMQAMDAESGVVAVDELERLGSQIKTLAAVHDLLTQQAKDDAQVESVGARDLLGKLLPMLESSATGRDFTYTVEADIDLTLRQGTSLALVANELVANAVKHGRGGVNVTFRVDGSTAQLEVSDQGPGFPEGFDVRQAAHTGLEMVEHLSRWDLGGSADYGTNLNHGQVRVTFPIGRG